MRPAVAAESSARARGHRGRCSGGAVPVRVAIRWRPHDSR
uniref:Uncharacterized protein n=1 Tax=Setaria italica TaxID=4555 RepID=K4ANZ2_SETIT